MFVHERKVTYSEVSENAYVDAAQIADYFQDCSCFQTDSLGAGFQSLLEQGRAWMLASWQIIIDRYPVYGEEIKVGTSPYAFDSFFGHRNFTIHDAKGNRIVVANSKWIMVDLQGGHPLRMDESITGVYTLDEKQEMDYATRKIPFRGSYEELPGIPVTGSLTDTNRHVNNAQYIRLALDVLPEGAVVRQIRCEYKNAAVKGDIIVPRLMREENLYKIALTDGHETTYAIVEATVKH